MHEPDLSNSLMEADQTIFSDFSHVWGFKWPPKRRTGLLGPERELQDMAESGEALQ